MTTDLRDVLHDELDTLVTPPGDLGRVRRAGTRLRRRRGAVAGAAAAIVIAVLVLSSSLRGSDGAQGDRGIDPIGQLDFSDGLRAYADPGRVLHLGDRTVSAKGLEALDTDAAATPYGIVFYVDGRPMLLEATGDTTPLQPGAEGGGHFRPRAKVDSVRPWVAYGATLDGKPTMVVRDLARGTVVGSRAVRGNTVVEALDGGVVFLRGSDGNSAWDLATDEETALSGPKTVVADVRNGVLLYDGPAPDGPAASSYRLVPGAVDAQLTFDGRHVLDWSRRLEATDGGAPVVLDQKGVFFTIDTDGSVLTAVSAQGDPRTQFYDCAVPSGTCAEIGTLKVTGGDPEFIGNDG